MRSTKKTWLYLVLVVVTLTAVVWRYKQVRSSNEDSTSEAFRHPTIDASLFPRTEPEPTLTNDRQLVSQLATQSQFETEVYAHWVSEIKEQKRFHRKQWEFVFIAQALDERGLLAPGKKGLGFGVGQEPLPALFAKYGAEVLATDLEMAKANEKGWVESGQHMDSLDVLNKRGIVKDEEFKRLVKGMNVDMTAIPSDLKGFDFTWSSCALGHLGNLQKGFTFIEDSLKTLKPGGVAVHTTELNLSSNTITMETVGTSVSRRKDIEALVKKLTAQGHEVTLNLNYGNGELDRAIDLPPYSDDKHIKIELGGIVATSFGLIIRKNPAATE